MVDVEQLLESLFTNLDVQPSQFWPDRELTPVQRLWLGVIYQSLLDLHRAAQMQTSAFNTRGRLHNWRLDIMAWTDSDDGSFPLACEVLECDFRQLRARIHGWLSAGCPMPSAHRRTPVLTHTRRIEPRRRKRKAA